MSGAQRLLLAMEMCDFSRELATSRICRQHPEWTKAQITRELLRLAFLPELLPASLR